MKLARCVLSCLAGLAGLVGAAVAPAAESVVDDRGKPVTFAAPPQRIVSLLPSLTETVCALGACARLVGVDRFSNTPASVQALPKLGGLEDAHIERIVLLKPDLVLAARSARLLDRLEALGVKVLALESNSHADVKRSFALVGRLLGTPAAADQAWAAIEKDVERAAQRIPPALRGMRVYFEVASTPYAAGQASFIGETLQRLQLANVAGSELVAFPRLNPEFVVRAAPDIVMAAERAARSMHERPGWQALPALQQGRVCAFDSARYESIIRPGPRLGQAALLIADCVARLR
jgi:iron complex transport system substrate-binding protein